MKFLTVLLLVSIISCNDSSSTSAPATSNPSVTYTQIERLGRPAINEGLVFTQAYNKAFNAIPPSADLSADAEPVRAEALVVLGLVRDLGNVLLFQGNDPTVVASGFLPDVLRIDTSRTVAVNVSAYNTDYAVINGGFPILTGGRKITDDVIDVTLSYLLDSNPFNDPNTGLTVLGDGVTYNGSTSAVAVPAACDTDTTDPAYNPGQPGHGCLVGQTDRTAVGNNVVFPYLPKPWSL